uniref:Chitin-binding type-2 domain-containing protein n=3 Tax=Pyretophorus TaxID=44537 RepID=A0A182PI70_9DIPT
MAYDLVAETGGVDLIGDRAALQQSADQQCTGREHFDHMKFLWFITFLLALVGMIAGDACPKGFKSQNNKCVTQRPVHGDCPKGSTYSAKVNLCVHN